MPATTQGLPKGIHKLRLTLGADGKRQLDLEAPPQVPNLPPPSQADVQAGLDPRGLGPPEPQYGSVLPLPPPQVPGGAENNAPHLPAPVVPDAGPQLPPPAQTAVAPVAQQAPAPSREDFAAALRPVKGQDIAQNPQLATAMLEAQDEVLNRPDLVAQYVNMRAQDIGRIQGLNADERARRDQVASESVNQLRAQFDPFVNSEIARLNDDYRNRRLTRDQYQQRVEVIAQLISQRGVAIEDILARRFGDGIRLSVGDATPSLNLADTDPARQQSMNRVNTARAAQMEYEQYAIEQADQGNMGPITNLQRLRATPGLEDFRAQQTQERRAAFEERQAALEALPIGERPRIALATELSSLGHLDIEQARVELANRMAALGEATLAERSRSGDLDRALRAQQHYDNVTQSYVVHSMGQDMSGNVHFNPTVAAQAQGYGDAMTPQAPQPAGNMQPYTPPSSPSSGMADATLSGEDQAMQITNAAAVLLANTGVTWEDATEQQRQEAAQIAAAMLGIPLEK